MIDDHNLTKDKFLILLMLTENLIRTAQNVQWSANTSMMDDEIKSVRDFIASLEYQF